MLGPGLGTAVGFGLGVAGSMLFDLYYDNKDKIAAKIQDVTDNVDDSVKDTTKKLETLFQVSLTT